jgi:hypothetical protein
MTNRGYLFALGRDQAKQFFGHRDEAAVLAYVRELRQQGLGLNCGTLWKLLHRCLAEQTDSGDPAMPLGLAFLGGRPMVDGEHLVRFVRPDLTTHVASALAEISTDELRLRLERVDPDALDSFEPLVDLLATVRAFYERAAGARQAVVFATFAE